MKQYILPILFLGTSLFISCDKKEVTGNLTINGKVEGLKQGVLYLHKIQDTTIVTLDSIIVKGDSNFSRQFNIDSPEMYYLTLDRGSSNSMDNELMFFAEPGTITIETTLKKFFSDAKVTGSKNNDIYKEYLKTRSAITDRQNELIIDIIKAENQNALHQKDSLMALSKKMVARKYLNAVNFALNHKDSDVSPYIALMDLYNRQIKYLDTINNSLTIEVKNGHYGKLLEAFIKERKELENEPITTDNQSE